MTKTHFAKFAIVTAAASLSACTTVRMPDLDFLKLPEFRDEANNIKGYPKASDAPTAPTDVRNATVWDTEAKKLMAERDSFNAPASVESTKSDTEIAREADALKAKVHAYKADDPQ